MRSQFLVDYILLDKTERDRLHIRATTRPFPRRTYRAPVPWNETYAIQKTHCDEHVHNINEMMLLVQNLWCSKYQNVRFVRIQDIKAEGLPVAPEEFATIIQQNCDEAQTILSKR